MPTNVIKRLLKRFLKALKAIKTIKIEIKTLPENFFDRQIFKAQSKMHESTALQKFGSISGYSDMNALCHFSLLVLLCAFFGVASPLLAASPVIPDERDRQVLETVFLRLLNDTNFDMTHASTNGTTIVLNFQTPPQGVRGMIWPKQMQQYIGEEHTIPSDVQINLQNRNEKPNTDDAQIAFFTDLKFQNGIVVTNVNLPDFWETLVFAKTFPKARAWVSLWLPGYSIDGSYAVVRAWIGPARHSPIVTVFLEKIDNAWLIKWLVKRDTVGDFG